MSTMYGADVTQLRSLAAQFDAAADRFENARLSTGSLVRSSPWSGPDAGLFRNIWESQHNGRLSQAVALLRDGAKKLRANADAQERASAVDGESDGSAWAASQFVRPPSDGPGPQGPLPSLADRFRDTLEWIDRLKANSLPGTGSSVGDAAGLIPGVGSASDVLGAANKIAQGQFPWHEGADLLGGTLRGVDNPIAYGVGVNVSLWADVT